MRWLRRLLFVLSVLLLLAAIPLSYYYYFGYYKPKHTRLINEGRLMAELAERKRLSQKAVELKAFLALTPHRYNEEQAFLIDMRMASGKNRFFVYDLRGDSIRMAGLVAHGSCNLAFSASPSFSNESGSGCSSLGHYRIGGSYQGHFGLAYKLHGMDTSNNQALARNVVLHSYECVPGGETDPIPICNSKGCAMIAPSFMTRLQPVLDASKKPILLWIFN